MIPVNIELIDIADEKTREAARMLLPEYVFNEPGVTLAGARAEGGVLAGALAFAPIPDVGTGDPAGDDRQVIRVHWIEVLPEYRRGGIGLLLINALTSYLAESENPPVLTIWYDDDDVSAGFEDFLDSLYLFETFEDESNGKPVHIAIWSGDTFESMEIDAE